MSSAKNRPSQRSSGRRSFDRRRAPPVRAGRRAQLRARRGSVKVQHVREQRASWRPRRHQPRCASAPARYRHALAEASPSAPSRERDHSSRVDERRARGGIRVEKRRRCTRPHRRPDRAATAARGRATPAGARRALRPQAHSRQAGAAGSASRATRLRAVRAAAGGRCGSPRRAGPSPRAAPAGTAAAVHRTLRSHRAPRAARACGGSARRGARPDVRRTPRARATPGEHRTGPARAPLQSRRRA